ncbi:MAG: hypothetical protein COA79_21260 [Planctomycetota bacterium]|nr:MAG: hypothetical protein COA79_21260 [Planctomycetota bacterium]
MKKSLLILILLFISFNCFTNDRVRTSDFSNFYFSPLRITRDHILHTSIFQPFMFSALPLEKDSGLIGTSFEYTSIDDSYVGDNFGYNFEGGLYRLNFFIDMNIFQNTEIILDYNIAGVDGDKFGITTTGGLIEPNIKKSGTGNIDLYVKNYLIKWNEIDFGFYVSATIPVDNTKLLAASRNFDFATGGLITFQREEYAVHLNLGFVYTNDPTPFISEAEFNQQWYVGSSFVALFVNNLYGIVQVSIQGPAMGVEGAPSGIVGQYTVGVRYVYDSYVSELWIGNGLGEGGHGIAGGIGLTLTY